eukprot:CAMPEP_0197634176 /NCGR_PEP_ID=MMETSP1338-20131121/10352_1 /TAXON_ID=43686 ORGANISM="Pelagodinium beii, Strain RCC1491" /NCGR_SAMPLE_ID=MMETSP1338 /ASSEMBLY_ACC=CAM_ASM_000754 /LENGTH=291 /DNA_ID=CAMNT_0043205995 /DNA_START=29 /DNA_END=901 /DNA_ORIENTATION=-
MAPKLLRADEAEIQRRWRAISIERRHEATRFDDPALVGCIRSAVQGLFQKQVVMFKMGMAGLGSEPDLFLGSEFLKEIFELKWVVEKSEEYPDAVIMNPELQPALMTLQPSMLHECRIFDRLHQCLPDFLGAKNGRSPLPRARWKQIFATEPSSVVALEQQLTKLAEQAFWAMGSNPDFEPKPELEPVAAKAKKKKTKKRGSTKSAQMEEAEEGEELMAGAEDSCGHCQQEESQQEEQPAVATSTSSRQAVVHHYWDWHEDSAPKPYFRWCLPASPFSRGYWARSKESTSD